MRTLKVLLALLLVLATLHGALADPAEDLARGSFRTTYNYATGKIDFYRMYNGSDFCLLDGTNCALGGGANSSISGSGSANQLAFWNGPASLTSNANFTLSGTTLRILTTVNASRLLVNNVDVCLANGTNCIAVANGTNGVDGINGTNGAQGPPGVDGTNGTNGATGPSGTNGLNGTRWFLNTSYPTVVNINDSFLNTSTGVYHTWNGTAWVFQGNFTGEKGAQGNQGTQGVTGDTGPTGPHGTNGTNGSNGTGISSIYVLPNGSLQINRTDGVNITSGNLTGATGSQGIQGIQGVQGDTGPTGPTGPAGTNGTDGNNFNYSNWFDQELNTTSGVTFDSVNTIGLTVENIEGLISLTVLSNPGRYFFVDDGTGKVGINLTAGSQLTGQSATFLVDGSANITGNIYTNGYLVCQSDGTNCPSYALNTHVANVNTTANIQRLGFNTTTQLNVVYVRNASIPTCGGTDKLTSAGNGVFTCATDQTGGGGGLTNTSDAYFGTLNSTKNLTAGEDLILLEQNNAIYFGAEKCVWMNGTNTVLGCSATLQNISATGTTVVGDLAGSAITSGSNNVAIGYGAMIAGKTSSDNVALGTFSLFRTVDGGNYNFALGRSSGASITTGDSNICIGFSACQNTGNKGNQYNITDGGQNIFIGTLAGPGDLGGNAQNRVAIGYQAECNRNDSVCLGMATTRQNVGINTDRPEHTLDVNGTLAVNGVHVTGSWTNYTTIKQNVFGTTLANITGLAWGAAANTNYTFDCDLFYMSNLTTNGISFAMEDWGGTVTWFEVATEIHTVAAATVNSATANTTGTKMTSTAVTAANTKYRASLDGIIINGASAVTITPQFSAEIAGSNSSIMRGSHCDVKVI